MIRAKAAGFYWIIFDRLKLIAEYTPSISGCNDLMFHWHIPGSAKCHRSNEIDSVISSRLEEPDKNE